MGSIVGLVIGPIIITYTEKYAIREGLQPLALPWFFLPAFIIAGMCLIYFVRPDPKKIGMNLGKYYPGYTPPPRRTDGKDDMHFDGWSLMRNVRTRLVIVANCAAQGNMSIVMVLTSLVLHHYGHSLSAIAVSHMFHSSGMFAFTIPLGKLADRFGRERVMYPGVAVALIGASLVAFTSAYWSVTLGTFLVGLGWAAANVAATALIADLTETQVRGRAIGVNESASGAVAVTMALVTGPILEYSGLPMTGLVAVLTALPPLVLWGYYRVKK